MLPGLFTQPTLSVQIHPNHSIYYISLFICFIYIRWMTCHLVFKSCPVHVVNMFTGDISFVLTDHHIWHDLFYHCDICSVMKHKSCIYFGISKATVRSRLVTMNYYILGLSISLVTSFIISTAKLNISYISQLVHAFFIKCSTKIKI